MKKIRLLPLLLAFVLAALSLTAAAAPLTTNTDDPAQTSAAPSDPEDTLEGEDSDEKPVQRIQVFDPLYGYPVEDDYVMNGKAAILCDLNSDTMLYTLNPDEKVYPASLTKLMSSLVILENGNLDDMVTVSSNAVNNISARTGDLSAGETLSLRDLLHCILISSSNEGCYAAAEHVAGSADAFVNLMNAKAAELGCTGTHFANPHGLHDDDHYTTARDLMIITKAVLAEETLREIVFSTSYEMPATNLQAAHTIYTTNSMTSTDQSHKYYYSLAKGVKTGYTSSAGRCLIVTAEKNHLNLLAIVLGCQTTEDENGEYVLHSFPEAQAMFEYGFDHFTCATVLSPLAPIAEADVSGGTAASVIVAPTETCTVALPKDYNPDDVTTEITLSGGNTVSAPFAAGEVVGTVSVYYKGKLMQTGEIAPITSVEAGSVFHSETPVSEPDTPVEVNRSGLSIWVVLLILAGLFLAFYLFSYLYHNLTRRKPSVKSKNGKKKSGTGRPATRKTSGSRRKRG